MPRQTNKPIKCIYSIKRGVYPFSGIVTRRSSTGQWVQIQLDRPYEDQTEIRLGGCDYGFVLPGGLIDGEKIRFNANVRPSNLFNNRYMNFRLVWDTDTAVNGKQFKRLSIYPEV